MKHSYRAECLCARCQSDTVEKLMEDRLIGVVISCVAMLAVMAMLMYMYS